jgi:hypothetical protein
MPLIYQPSKGDKPGPPRYVIERMVDVTDKIPRGIWKMMAEEPVDRTERDMDGLWESRPLRLEDIMGPQGRLPSEENGFCDLLLESYWNPVVGI